MNRHIVFFLTATGLTLLPFASANAFETGQAVVATAITALPFTITVSGNYYLPSDLATAATSGAAITISASHVTLDLNGRTLSATSAGTNADGVLVSNQADVTVQNGNIDGFSAGVYFSPASTPVNAKNTASNLKLNGNTFGVLSASGTSNLVKDCVIDGGDVGIWFSQDSGSRARNNLLANQQASASPGLGVALVSSPSFGVVFDDNVVTKGSNALGMIMSGTDKYRFNSFVGFPKNSPHIGGTNEKANSL
jgi:Right handed beta helix region